jgi:CBS domain-containing protein
MVREKLSGIAVLDAAGALVGVLSEGDLLRRSELGTTGTRAFWTRLFSGKSEAIAYRHDHGRRVRDVMSEGAVTIEATDTLADAARLMETHSIKRLPVLSGNQLVGMLTRSDFVKALGRFLTPAYEEPPVSDDEINAKIRGELDRHVWSAGAEIDITSENGVVTLRGFCVSEQQRRAILVAAEIVEGVSRVEDQLEVRDSVPLLG